MAKHKCPEFENHERWLVSYADMVTLLFAVFVVLFALKEDGQKSNDAAGSLEESFNKPLEDIPPSQMSGDESGGFGIFEYMGGNSPTPPVADVYDADPQPIKVIDSEMNLVSRQIEERLYGSQKFRDDSKPGTSRVVSIERTARGFKVQLLARHFFEPGALKVKRSAIRDLDSVIVPLKKLGREVRVEGHTDALGRKGTDNWDLSALRATEVLKRMVKKHRFPPSLLSAGGYGDTKPLASNSTASGRAMNRRIEFSIHYDENKTLVPP